MDFQIKQFIQVGAAYLQRFPFLNEHNMVPYNFKLSKLRKVAIKKTKWRVIISQEMKMDLKIRRERCVYS